MQILQKYSPHLWCVIIILALLVRFWKIEYIPFANDADELAQIWAGQSLIEYGVPIAWSSFSYPERQWYWTEVPSLAVVDTQVAQAELIRPWFDHSFVLPLLVGGWTELWGYRFPSIPPALLYRLPMLAVAGGSLILVYQLARRLTSVPAALLALSLIAFSPSLIFAHRMVVAENLLTLFLLWAVYLVVTNRSVWWVVLATVLAGLVKLPALCIVPIVVWYYWAAGQRRAALTYPLAVGLGVAGILSSYGMSIDGPAFWAALQHQSARLLGWSNPAFIFSHPGFHTRPLLDFSYYLLLCLGIAGWLVAQRPGQRLVALGGVAYWLTIWVTSAEQDMLGWYKLPLFSFLAVATAFVFDWLLTTSRSRPAGSSAWAVIIIFWAVMLLNNLGIVRYPAQPLPEAAWLRLLVGGVLLLSLGLFFSSWRLRWVALLLTVWVGLSALQAGMIVDQYFAASCRDRNCPTPTVTLTQLLRQGVAALR